MAEPELKSPEKTLFVESLKRQNIEADSLNLLNVSSIPKERRRSSSTGPNTIFRNWR
jgi:hypothetical protein